jgi:serine/threonine-protein kinase RsbW
MSLIDRPPTRFDRLMPADVRLLMAMRADLREWLIASGVGADDRDAIVLACSEALANAIEHAYLGDPSGVVHISGWLRGEVLELAVSDRGSWIPPQPNRGANAPFGEVRGRGLRMIEQLMDGAEVSTTDGTTVLMRRRVVLGPT